MCANENEKQKSETFLPQLDECVFMYAKIYASIYASICIRVHMRLYDTYVYLYASTTSVFVLF